MGKRKPAKIVEYSDHIAIIANNTGREFIFDKDMKEKLQGYGWNKNGPGYLHARVNGEMTFAHHLVVKKPGPRLGVVDHINRNPLDNRRVNLRIISQSENLVNSCRRSDNRTGYKGVAFNRERGKFIAFANKNRRRIFIGRFDTAEEVAMAYDKKAIELYGERACTNAALGLLKVV